jgi:replicative DNA helicase
VISETAGRVDQREVEAEYDLAVASDTPYSDGGFADLVGLMRMESQRADLRRVALSVVERIGEGETPEQVAPLVSRMHELTRPRVADEVQAIGDNMHELFTGNDADAVPLGLECLHDLRVVPGNLTVLAARPGGGKTAMLGTITLAASRQGWRCLFFSLEMPGKQIRQRLLSGFARVPLTEVVNPQDASLVPHANRMGELPIGIRDAVAGDTLTVERIVNTVRAYRLRHPNENMAVFVDYLQLVKSREAHDRRHELIGHVCRELKACALRERVPMIVGAQVGRGAEQRGKDAKPQLSDLRESGDIENTADQVVLMHREMGERSAAVAVAKNRMGRPFACDVDFIGELCLFADPVAITRADWQ